MTPIELTEDDGAVVFKKDGTEVYLPSDEGIDGDDSVPEHVMQAGMCVVLLSDTAFAQSLRAMIRAHMKAVLMEEDGNE